MLYPFIFKPIFKSVIWGGNAICPFKGIPSEQEKIGESWEVSHVANNVSIVDNGRLAGKSLNDLIEENGEELMGKSVTERFGKKFPLLIKFIDARDDLSIQVHPDDRLANERHQSFGKTEMWYIIRATPEAFLYSGFAESLPVEKYKQSIEDNTFTDYLAKHSVREGDVFFLPAGRVHAIGAGCFLAEIQQTSDITYRIYDYNRKDTQGNPRELHTGLAEKAIDFQVYPDYQVRYQPRKDQEIPLVACPYFTTNFLEIENIQEIDLKKRDSFTIFICMQGNLILKDNNNNELNIKQGQTVLVPASCQSVTLIPSEGSKLLETFIQEE